MADRPTSPDEIQLLARVLDGARVPYAYIGGVALGAWGVPRTTFDLDAAILVDESTWPRIVEALESGGFAVDEVFRGSFRDRLGDMELVHAHLPIGPTLLRADLFFVTTPFLRSVLRRSVVVELAGRPLRVCTPADFLLLKLVAGRKKDELDIENVLTVQGVPEREYLEHWAVELGVRDRLDATLREAGYA
jgi:hypothetical protein